MQQLRRNRTSIDRFDAVAGYTIKESVANSFPVRRNRRRTLDAFWYFSFLMETANVPGDVLLNRSFLDRHHGNWAIRRQPVRTIIAAGVVTDVVHVAE